MYVVLGNEKETNSVYGLDCFACRATLTISVDWYSGYNDEDVSKLANDIGWQRREFHKSSNPWFCSRDCAFESPKAKFLEDIWRTYEEDQKTKPVISFFSKIKDFIK